MISPKVTLSGGDILEIVVVFLVLFTCIVYHSGEKSTELNRMFVLCFLLLLFYYQNAEHFYAFRDILKSVFTRIQGEADYEKTQNLIGEF